MKVKHVRMLKKLLSNFMSEVKYTVSVELKQNEC